MSALPAETLSPSSRLIVLAAAFLGWVFAGLQMGITSLVLRDATVDLLSDSNEESLVRWFAFYVTALLIGAVIGGWWFGRLGDRVGRVRGLALSILCYSLASAASYWAASPLELTFLRMLVGLGVGGAWPNGVALVSEAWPDLSKPMTAGVIGCGANIGISGMALLGIMLEITPDHWRWVMLVGASPLFIGIGTYFWVPESPSWVKTKNEETVGSVFNGDAWQVFRRPLLKNTLLGIALGAVAFVGGWGSANWLVPWASSVGVDAEVPDYALKAQTQLWRGIAGIFGGLTGGWFAAKLGRRRSYFLISLASLLVAQFLFRCLLPGHNYFLPTAAFLGFVGNLYFGWLPLYLPEMFPTSVRATGCGVSFHFGRIASAITVLATGLLVSTFAGDYARIGTMTSWVFAAGMAVTFFLPTQQKNLSE